MLGSFFQTYSLNMKLFSFRFHQLWWPALWHAQCALPSFTEFFPRTRTRREKMSKKKKEEKGNGPEWTEFRIRCTFFFNFNCPRSDTLNAHYRVLPSFFHARVHVERKCLKKRKRKKETDLNELNSVFDVPFFLTLIVRALTRSMRITEFYRVCPRTRTRREKMS